METMGIYRVIPPKSHADFCKLYQRMINFKANSKLTVNQLAHAQKVVDVLLEYISSCKGVIDTFNLNRSIEIASLPDLEVYYKSGYLVSSKRLEGLQDYFEAVEPVQLLADQDSGPPTVRQSIGGKDGKRKKRRSLGKSKTAILLPIIRERGNDATT